MIFRPFLDPFCAFSRTSGLKLMDLMKKFVGLPFSMVAIFVSFLVRKGFKMTKKYKKGKKEKRSVQGFMCCALGWVVGV